MSFIKIVLSFLIFSIISVAVLPCRAMTAQLSSGEEESDTNFNYLMLEEEILPKDIVLVQKLLDKQFDRKRRTAILLTSPGGALEAVSPLAQLILKASLKFYRKYHRSIFLVINQECSSACNILVATLTHDRDSKALEIYVAENAKFAFHSPVAIQDKKIVAIKDLNERSQKQEKMLAAYRGAQVSSDWLKQKAAWFKDTELHTVTGLELCREKTLVIPPNSCYSSKLDIFEEITKAMAKDKAASLPTL